MSMQLTYPVTVNGAASTIVIRHDGGSTKAIPAYRLGTATGIHFGETWSPHLDLYERGKMTSRLGVADGYSTAMVVGPSVLPMSYSPRYSCVAVIPDRPNEIAFGRGESAVSVFASTTGVATFVFFNTTISPGTHPSS